MAVAFTPNATSIHRKKWFHIYKAGDLKFERIIEYEIVDIASQEDTYKMLQTPNVKENMRDYSL